MLKYDEWDENDHHLSPMIHPMIACTRHAVNNRWTEYLQQTDYFSCTKYNE